MIQITLKDTTTGQELTRNYANSLFAETDMEKLGEKVWCMWETLSEPYNGEFDSDEIAKAEDTALESEMEQLREEQGDMEDMAKDNFLDK